MTTVRIQYFCEKRRQKVALKKATFKNSEDMWRYIGTMHKFLGETFRGFSVVQQGADA